MGCLDRIPDAGTRKADRKDSPPDTPEDRTGNGALDLEECKICRAWVAGEACEREACPYRR